ncbi:hypothetical protein [Streptomyces flavofungini]|uniref:hypothetical protein n=1 Tax=Streptomyces flavofungini TaxID=68200 RepID=UPI0025B1A440|nr:hypothetical protein [Streptomyces flavofungini]WJV51700.1 hypothetical protein QUY26_40280 [Streptomyces flavofungini]
MSHRKILWWAGYGFVVGAAPTWTASDSLLQAFFAGLGVAGAAAITAGAIYRRSTGN